MNRPLFRRDWWCGRWFLIGLYALIAAGVTAHQLWVRPDSINNFMIFRSSFDLLASGADLYVPHPDRYEDLYKYSPTFALMMAPFRALPVGLGLLCWNLCNVMAVLWAVMRLPITRRGMGLALLFIVPLLIGSTQNTQSNGLMAGLMIGAFGAFERRQIVLAALLVCLGFYVKIFGVAAGVFFVCYDRKWRFVLTGIAIGVVLALAPIPLTGVKGLVTLYESWLTLLKSDAAHEMNISFVTFLSKSFGLNVPHMALLAPSVVLLLLPLLRAEVRGYPAFRLLFCGCLLVWAVIFNHKAESPTYVIAAAGVALWALVEPPSRWRLALLLLVFVLTGLSHGDLLPRRMRDEVVGRYGLKVVPCIIVWGVMTWRLLACRASSMTQRLLLPAVNGEGMTSIARPA